MILCLVLVLILSPLGGGDRRASTFGYEHTLGVTERRGDLDDLGLRALFLPPAIKEDVLGVRLLGGSTLA